MANSASNIDGIVQGQGAQDLAANAVFDAASPATLYGRRASTSSGLVWGYYGGKVLVNGVVTEISNSTITLTASATNYLEADPATGAVSKNTTAFTAGKTPLYSIVAGSATVTSYTDQRLAVPDHHGLLAKTMTDTDAVLTVAEARNHILSFSGTLTATRNVQVPLTPRQWTVYNGTGQSLQFIGASGTGVTVATLKRAIIYSDGTNVVRVTADT